MPIDTPFYAAYQTLQERMKELAESDGDIFLPNPEPAGPARYVLICMEPSLGLWARSAEEAKEKVEAGFRNFLFSLEDFILHFAARHYLCAPGEHYHVTDMSKGAMLVQRAAVARSSRYDRWYSLLLEELDLVGGSDAKVIAVGGAVAQHLSQRSFPRPFARIVHYSGQAAPARNAAVVGHEEGFRLFSESVSTGDLLADAEATLVGSRVPARFREETMVRLNRMELSVSRKKLLFGYKVAFEALRLNRRDSADDVMLG